VFATAYDDASIASAASALSAAAIVWKREMLTKLVPSVRRALLFHAVYFYDDSPSLAHPSPASSVADWRPQAAVIVATATNAVSIREQLTADGVDSRWGIEQGELLILNVTRY
jgi:hypothetical protein